MTRFGDHIEEALTVLRGIPNTFVRLAGADASADPADLDRLIVVDIVDAVAGADYEEADDRSRIQVDTYGRQFADAVQLGEEARVALQQAGFAYGTSRRKPRDVDETHNGLTTDFLKG